MTRKAILELQAFLDNYPFGDHKEILEAGCGSLTQVDFSGSKHIIGIDISQEQLDKNSQIDEKILGDVEKYPLEANRFDVIISWEVVEHLCNPAPAFVNFSKSVKENGLVIIAAPNSNSLKGLITRLTPHWFHVLIYKYVFNKQDAGQPGCAPFPTIFHESMSEPSIRSFAGQNNMEVVFTRMYDAFPRIFVEKRKFLFFCYRTVAGLLKIMSGGKLGGSDNNNFIIVLKKLPRSPA